MGGAGKAKVVEGTCVLVSMLPKVGGGCQGLNTRTVGLWVWGGCGGTMGLWV